MKATQSHLLFIFLLFISVCWEANSELYILFSFCVCYLYVTVVCCLLIDCSPSDATSSTSTTTTANDSDSDSDSENKSKPWLKRIFSSSDNNKSVETNQATEYNAAKHFDLKNVRQDFNRPIGNGAAPGVRVSKTGRKIRWGFQQTSIQK